MSISKVISQEQGENIRLLLGSDKSYTSVDVNYAKWSLLAPFVKVTLYNTNMLVIQGKSSDMLYKLLFPVTERKVYAGLDEVGKGDYFGPLVTACVAADTYILDRWRRKGVKDSKRLDEYKIRKLAKLILNTEGAVVKVNCDNNEVYNSLIESEKNLNIVLAKYHWRAIKGVVSEIDVDNFILDKFASEDFINSYMPEELKDLNVSMYFKAEQNISVAAASIVAKYYQLEYFDSLAKRFNIVIPRGCNKNVIEVGKILVKQYGEEILNEVAKLHFKTTLNILTN